MKAIDWIKKNVNAHRANKEYDLIRDIRNGRATVTEILPGIIKVNHRCD